MDRRQSPKTAFMVSPTTLFDLSSFFDHFKTDTKCKESIVHINRFVTKELEKVISNSEVNDGHLRSKLYDSLDCELSRMKSEGKLIDYYVICNETNNTPEVIICNGVVVDIIVKVSPKSPYCRMTFSTVPQYWRWY